MAAANHHARLLSSQGVLYERSVHINGVHREILESIWDFMTNTSHYHDTSSIIGLEVGDGARHDPQKYQMVKHQLVQSNEHPDQNSHIKCHCTQNMGACVRSIN